MKIQRQTLGALVAQELEKRISAATYINRLPAESALAATLGVSRKAVRNGIAILRREGRIETRNGSGSWIVATDRQSSPPSLSRIIMLSGIHWNHSVLFSALRSELLSRDWDARWCTDKRLFHENAARCARQWIEQNGDATWVLSSISDSALACFAEIRERAILLGTTTSRLELSSCDWDFPAISFHAAGLLKSKRYTDVLLIYPARAMGGDQVMLECLKQDLPRQKLRHTIMTNSNSSLFRNRVVNWAQNHKGSGVIFCFRPHTAVAIYLALLKAGLEVPNSVGLICRHTDPFLKEIGDSISRYDANPDILALNTVQQIERMTRTPSRKARNLKLIPEFIPGDTLR